MGILDTILGAVKNQVSNSTATATANSDNSLLESVIGLISNPESGGLSGLVQKISESGLGDQVASWVGTGQNLPVNGDQILAALGSPFVQNLASKLGINTSDVAANLANLLPQVVDKLTPDGQVPGDNNLLQMGIAGLTSLLGNNKTA
jgi:uncharacterized protein YidB (DUF937 family)